VLTTATRLLVPNGLESYCNIHYQGVDSLDMLVNRTLPSLRSALLFLPFLVLFVTGCIPAQLGNREHADELIKNAQRKFAESNYKDNVRLLKEASAIDPTNPRVWWKLCEAYQLTEEFDLAVAACKREIEIDPGGLSYNSLGLAYTPKKDYPNAVTAFERAVKDSPKPGVYLNLVGALQSLQQYDKATAAAQRMVEVSAADPSELNLALPTLIWAQVRAKQYEQAIPAAQRLVEVSAEESSERALGLEALGAIYVKLDRKEKAQEVFAKIPKINSKQNVRSCEFETDSKGGLVVKCSFFP
jgi:tetratricopeptide (TPR) repeat protein